MPEGPEIRRVADRLAKVLVGETLEAVEFGLEHLSAAAIRGARVLEVDSRGKALLTRFDNGLTLFSHNQLYGRWYVCRRGQRPQTNRQLRAALHTPRHSALLYSASAIELLTDEQLSGHPFLSRLGPDVLDDALTWRAIAERLGAERFCGRSLAALYLDQGFLAGVGNYLRSEILFFAGLAPQARPAALSRAQRNRLARESLAVSRRAYRTAGVTNRPSRVVKLRQSGVKRRDFRFAVFGRAGSPCYDCGSIVERIDAGSRRLYSCPACQA